LKIGLAAIARLDVVGLAEPQLRAIADQTQLTALLSVWGDRGATIVRWQRAPMPFITTIGLGSILPTTTSATGIAFMAFLPASVVAPIINQESCLKVDADQLTKCRERRIAQVDGTVVPGLRAMASPILDLQGDASAVITLIGADHSLAEPGHAAAEILCAATATVSASLGFRG